MKKIFILFLTVILAASFCACGSPSAPVSAAPSAAEEAVAEKAPIVSEKKPAAVKRETIIFEEQTIVDNEECLVRITGIDPDNIWGYTLKVYLENKSADKTYMYSLDNCAVNGVQCSAFFATEVAAGKKANTEINIMDSSLEENGIVDYTDIELAFRVYDSNDWSADNVAQETVRIYPCGQTKAAAFVREPKGTDEVLVDNDYATVTVLGYYDDEIWGWSVKLYILNKSAAQIMFSVENASVNGYMADPFYSVAVAPGKCTFSTMSWSDDSFAENGITAVDEVEFTLRGYDWDDWMSDDYFNETIILKP